MRRDTNVPERGGHTVFRLFACSLVLVLLASCSASTKSASTPTTTSVPDRRRTTTVPQPAGPLNIYAHSGAGMLSATARSARSLIYVPESMSEYVDVIDPATYRVIDRYRTGGLWPARL